MLKQADTDGDGKLSREEAPPFLKKQFAKIDTNNDGFLDKTELEAWARIGQLRRMPARRQNQAIQPSRQRSLARAFNVVGRSIGRDRTSRLSWANASGSSRVLPPIPHAVPDHRRHCPEQPASGPCDDPLRGLRSRAGPHSGGRAGNRGRHAADRHSAQGRRSARHGRAQPGFRPAARAALSKRARLSSGPPTARESTFAGSSRSNPTGPTIHRVGSAIQ